MAFRLIPKEESFFDMFEQAANRLVTAAGVLVEATGNSETLADNAKRLERLEHDADQLTHELVEKVNRSFITPFDREDIYRLATELDDVMDLMEATTERFILFKVQQVLPQAQEIAKVIQQQTQEIQRVMPRLRRLSRDSIMPHCVEINRLENVGDRLLRDAMAALFDGRYDPLTVIKWRELYELMEQATDKCEDVANTIEGIVLKNA
jgi:predicted phosphate transport protein (TIGR00153 family)